MTGVVGVVLAAGASTRMGTQKLLLPFGDGTILETTVAAVGATGLDRVVVVTGADTRAIEQAIGSSPATIVRNPDPRRGNMSSLLTAVAAVPDAEAFVLVPGDMPTIDPEAIDTLLELWRSQKPWAAVTRYGDRIAHPFLLSSDCVEEASASAGEKVLWRVLVHSDDPRVIRVERRGSAPLDVNTPTDYDELRT